MISLFVHKSREIFSFGTFPLQMRLFAYNYMWEIMRQVTKPCLFCAMVICTNLKIHALMMKIAYELRRKSNDTRIDNAL